MNKCIKINYKSLKLLVTIICCLGLNIVPCAGQGMHHAKAHKSLRDSVWSTQTLISDISKDGQWAIFCELYDTIPPINYLVSTKGSSLINLKKGEKHSFSSSSKWFGYINSEGTLVIRNLKDGGESKFPDLTSFKFSYVDDYLIAYKKDAKRQKSFQIIDLEKGLIFQQDNVTDYAFNTNNSKVIITVKAENRSQLLIYDYKKNFEPAHIISQITEGEFFQPKWNENGTHFAIIEERKQSQDLAMYDVHGKVWRLESSQWNASFPNNKISKARIAISKNADKIFFYIQAKENLLSHSDMKVWDTQQKWIDPKYEVYYLEDLQQKLIVWKPFNSVYFAIGDNETPTVKADPNLPYALVYDRLKYEPVYKEYEQVDLYLKSTTNADKNLVIENVAIDQRYISLSPSGRYVSFFKDKNWWVYDTTLKSSKNLTQNLNISFFDEEDNQMENKRPYGNPGYMQNEKYIIFYDRYDIWLFQPDGKFEMRITKGREKKISYRINWQSKRNDQLLSDLRANLIIGYFNFETPIILDMLGDDYKSGFALWKEKRVVNELLYSEGFKNQLLISNNSKTFVYTDFKINSPPAVYSYNFTNAQNILLYQSNEKLLGYDLGNYEQVNYSNSKGDLLNGMLIYPSHYDPQKRYPMITYIYEKNSVFINSFYAPSNYNSTGFNILRYTTDGFFVLLPDIKYEIGNPGISALDCVTAAVNKVLQNNTIDRSKIGLIGHSYGGYEAAFIATQTEAFQAVVAGAAVTDLVNFYHDISWNLKESQSWRMENQQFRMGGSFYGLKELYLANSPLNQIEKLKTPLLLWTGKNDDNINWYQSIFMYMGMKRLNKEGKLILFENENHVVLKSKNQQQLSNEVYSWFAKHLK